MPTKITLNETDFAVLTEYAKPGSDGNQWAVHIKRDGCKLNARRYSDKNSAILDFISCKNQTLLGYARDFAINEARQKQQAGGGIRQIA